jgi:hypothetical protein
MNLTRSFCYWPDFMPAPDHLDEEVLGHFGDFLDRHLEAGMGTVPTFIVGHMSGENWDPAWRRAATCTATSGWSPARPGSSAS